MFDNSNDVAASAPPPRKRRSRSRSSRERRQQPAAQPELDDGNHVDAAADGEVLTAPPAVEASAETPAPAPPPAPEPVEEYTGDPMKLSELKRRSAAELLEYAEELGIENASTLRKPDLVFATLKRLAQSGVPIQGEGVLEILQDGFGFLRTPDVNYLAGA